MRIPPVTLALGLCALSMGGCSPDDAPTAGPAFPNPRAGFPSNGRTLGYIANQYADTISVLDLGTLAVLGEVPVGINPVELDGPAQVRLDPTRGVAYVLLTYPLSVVGAHAVAHGARPPFGYVRELSLLDLTPLGGLPVDRRAASLALSADHSLAAGVHFDQDLALLPTDLDARRATLDLLTPAWDLQTGTANKRAQPVCVAPLGVVLGGKGARAFVACTGEDSLAVVDTNSITVLTRVPAGAGPVNKPTAIVVATAGQQVLLSNQLTSQVVAFAGNDSDDQPMLRRAAVRRRWCIRLLTCTRLTAICMGAASLSCSSSDGPDAVDAGRQLFQSRELSSSDANIYTCGTCFDIASGQESNQQAVAVAAATI